MRDRDFVINSISIVTAFSVTIVFFWFIINLVKFVEGRKEEERRFWHEYYHQGGYSKFKS